MSLRMPLSCPEGKPVLLLAGPTASGKSALALTLAAREGGVVINADSMQVYRGLAVLTAQPTADEQAQVPHRLYGDRDPEEACSVAVWRDAALAAITAAVERGQRAIVVGGTGMYLKALLTGLSPIPAIPPAILAEVADLSPSALWEALQHHDPTGAARLKPTDRQRLQRALAVVLATGQPLAAWQAQAGMPLPYPAHTVLLWPERQDLYARINARFAQMLADGAVAEVELLLARGLDPDLPAMKAVGVPELAAYLRGELSLADATALAQQHSRYYAKRQYTWFRHQMAWDQVVEGA